MIGAIAGSICLLVFMGMMCAIFWKFAIPAVEQINKAIDNYVYGDRNERSD